MIFEGRTGITFEDLGRECILHHSQLCNFPEGRCWNLKGAGANAGEPSKNGLKQNKKDTK